MGSGRVPTWIGFGAVAALLALAPVAAAQPIRRVAGLDEPFSGAAALPTDGRMTQVLPLGPMPTAGRMAQMANDEKFKAALERKLEPGAKVIVDEEAPKK